MGRSVRGDLNRVINAESANLQRAVGAAGGQLGSDRAGLRATRRRSAANAGVTWSSRLVAARRSRAATPESTTAELAERITSEL